MYTVDDVMNDSVYLVPGHAPVKFAALEMERLNVGMLIVLRDGKLEGMLTERDIARKIVAHGLAPETTKVEEIMTKPVVCLRSGAPIPEACDLMRTEHLKYLPVVNQDSEPLGILGMTDLITFFGNNAELTELFDGE